MSCGVEGLCGQNLRPHAGLECLRPIQQWLSGPIKEWPREHGEFWPVLPGFKKTVVMRRESEGRVVIKEKERGAFLGHRQGYSPLSTVKEERSLLIAYCLGLPRGLGGLLLLHSLQNHILGFVVFDLPENTWTSEEQLKKHLSLPPLLRQCSNTLGDILSGNGPFISK